MAQERRHPENIIAPEEDGSPGWARRLGDLCRELQGPCASDRRARLREEAWCLLDTAVLRLVRWHARRYGAVDADEAADIAAEKSLDLLLRAEAGGWDLTRRTGADMVAYLSSVARNGLVDRLRHRSRMSRVGEGIAHAAELAALDGRLAPAPDPSRAVEAHQYADQLARCVSKLGPRARVAFFLRALHEWPSARIATHPEVRMPVAHVDVELHRARAGVRQCMARAGFDVRDIPPGVFTALWAVVFGPAAAGRSDGEERAE